MKLKQHAKYKPDILKVLDSKEILLCQIALKVCKADPVSVGSL